ncbi:hypothetical protein F4820DRAFT_409920 [Hypoxylon rubiginosum]|uniref:Uncharacterized protein n=1 Tax=Hypoxylon rubiginosum TaxID=110542 RepID=A0ACB9Z9Z4_9PEZI|nr:hypothetical protein F4820DRAFT_409920 [Hypoxylon rubiginosum]
MKCLGTKERGPGIPAPTWTTLLPELKAQICELLYVTHPLSLVNLASTSKNSYAVAAIFLFRTIKVFVNERDKPQPNLQQYINHLELFGALNHVRRLVIYGPGWRNTELTGFGYQQPKLIRTLAYVPDLERENDEDPLRTRFDKHTGVDVLDNIRHSAFVPDSSYGEVTYPFDEQWRPLANLIRQLPMLSDVIYQCSTQFPPCLLEALHEHQPVCRLHVDSFRLRCLGSTPMKMDQHELMLITSPCLHSINIRTGERDLYNFRHWVPVHHLGAIFRLVAGVTPNIKEVHVSGMHSCQTTQHGEWHSSFRPRWESLPIPRAGPRQKGSLSCLQLCGSDDHPIGGQDIDDWGAHTDFTALRTLKLDSEVTQSALETLVNKHSFPSLETLSLSLEPLALPVIGPVEYCLLLERFLQSLPRLSTLKITNWQHHFSLDWVLGPGLRTLWLEPRIDFDRLTTQHDLTAQNIAQIRERCPLLKNLTLVVRRSKGDSSESALYRELGTLPKLQHLSLKMDPSRDGGLLNPTWSWNEDPSFAHVSTAETVRRELLRAAFFQMEDLRKKQAQDMFINSAVDDSLALAIFKAISETKERHNIIPLDKLEIRLVDPNFPFTPNGRIYFELEKYISMLGRSWQVVRMPRDGSGQVLMAQEINKKERERASRRIEEDFRGVRKIVTTDRSRPLEVIFREIWPQRREGSTLQEDWRSWPLSTPTT